MKIFYSIGVFTPAGWRPVSICAMVECISPKMARVISVETIDGKAPSHYMSRTGSKRQKYDGAYFAAREIGKRKRLSDCVVFGESC